jgi:hypothetical protein
MLDPFFSSSLDLVQLQVHMGRFSGSNIVGLVDKTAGIDELNSIQCPAAPVALISTGVLVLAIRANSFDKTICEESRNHQNMKTAIDSIRNTLNNQYSMSAPFLAFLSNHSFQGLGRSPDRF